MNGRKTVKAANEQEESRSVQVQGTNEKPEDRRITKSKNKLKKALIRLLSEKALDEISVTEICQEADTTRITFYTYYPDKFALSTEIFNDLAEATEAHFHALQAENNPSGKTAQSFCNLLDGILDLFYGEEPLLPFELERENPNLYQAFSQYLTKRIENMKLQKNVQYEYPVEMLVHFLCDGLWSFVCEGRKQGQTVEQLREEARSLIKVSVKEAVKSRKKAQE